MATTFSAGEAVRVDTGRGYVGARFVRQYDGRNGQPVFVVTISGRERRVSRINIAKALAS